MPFNEQKWKKSLKQSLYSKGLFDSFSRKDHFFESFLRNKDDYFLQKYDKQIILDGTVYFSSELVYELPEKEKIQELNSRREAVKKLYMVDIERRMNI